MCKHFENYHVCFLLEEQRVFACTPALPVTRNEGRMTDWPCALCVGHNTTGQGKNGLGIQTRLRKSRGSSTEEEKFHQFF